MQDFKYTIKNRTRISISQPYPVPVLRRLLLWKLVARWGSLVFGVFILLVLIPSTAENVLESVLERATVHVDQSFFLFRLWVTEDGNET